jgi:hypothetical protein
MIAGHATLEIADLREDVVPITEPPPPVADFPVARVLRDLT